MTDMTGLKVGDDVIVTGRYVGTTRSQVARVGRTYFYVENTRDIPFLRSTGREKPDGYGNGARAGAVGGLYKS
jgi:hypothetical protein